MKKQSFILSAIILTLGGFFAKAIGALYKIPLANILGSSGMGIYYLIFPLYSLIITFCSSGLSVALTTEVAKCRKIHHRYNEQKLLRCSLILSFFLSMILTFVVILLSNQIAEIQGNINAKFGYIAIAPAIIISSLIATLRGYFQGIENMIPTTVSMVIEQIIKLSIGLILAHKLCIFGIEYAVLGAVLGVTISEIVAFLIISINFFIYKGQLDYNYRNKKYKSKRKIKDTKSLKCKKFLKHCSRKSKSLIFKMSAKSIRYTNRIAILKLLKIAIPCTMASLIIPISSLLDSFMIINLLVKSGYSSFISTSLYGIWGGIVQSLISLPIIVISAITTSLVPSLSGLVVYNNINEIKYRTTFFIKLTWIFGIILFVIFFVFAEDILYFLYGDGLDNHIIDELKYATLMLKLSSVSIVYYAFLQTFSVILETMGKSHIPFLCLLISLMIRTLLIILLVSRTELNIFGAIIANIIFLSISTLILAIYITKKIDLQFVYFRQLLRPAIIGFVILILMDIVHNVLKEYINYILSLSILAILGLCIYIISMYFGRVFTDRELKYIKFKKNKISKIK